MLFVIRIATLLVLACGLLRGQGGPQRTVFASFRSMHLEEAMPGAAVHAMVPDRQGRLWAGTDAGLACFSGKTWREVGLGPDRATPAIRALLCASDGSLWVGTEHLGIWRLKDGAWTSFRSAGGGPLPADRIQTLIEAPGPQGASRIWVGTERGVAYYQDGAWSAPADPQQLAGVMIWKLRALKEPDGATRVWAATVRGLARFVDGRWEWPGLPGTIGAMPGSAMMDMHANDVISIEGEGGRLEVWASIWNVGMLRWDGARWTRFGPREGFPGTNPTVLAAGQRAGGRTLLWAGTYDQGMAWYDGTWHPVGKREGGSSNTILSLCPLPGSRPSLLVGTRNAGVQAVDLGGWASLGLRQGLPLDQVTCFAETQANRDFWVGTASGLVRWDGRTGEATAVKGPASAYVTSLQAGADGRELWVGTLKGLVHYDGASWRLLGEAEGFPPGTVYMLRGATDARGVPVLLAGHAKGLAWLRQGRWNFDLGSTEFEGATALGLGVGPGREGALWAMTRRDGIRRLQDGVWSWVETPDEIRVLKPTGLLPLRDAQGRLWLWMGTSSGSLACVPVDQPGRAPRILGRESLPVLSGHPVRSVCADAQGRIYATSLGGVLRITLDGGDPDKPFRAVEGYTLGDGIPGQSCTGSFLDVRGRIWVATTSGAAVFDPGREAERTPPAAPFVASVEDVDRQAPVAPGARLDHRRTHLMFEFGLPVHHRFEDTEFRTELVGKEPPGPWRSSPHRELSGL
ncbi:MAG TPA: two-component regulator propeller domain-containing protein, partial [Holophaga sp.]|nr:two-component regulator propeller domain-containing protein [Holophaga sp.]